MNKQYCPIWLWVTLAVIASSSTLSVMPAEKAFSPTLSPVAAVRAAAQAGLKLFLPRASGRQSEFGFLPADALDRAALGLPLPLRALAEDDITAWKPGNKLASLLKPSGRWLVPVQVDGTNRAMLEVISAEGGGWTAAGIGMAPLARKWQQITTRWPEQKGFKPELVVASATPGYFLALAETDPPTLTALSAFAADTAVNGPPPALTPLDQAMAKLAEAVRQLRQN